MNEDRFEIHKLYWAALSADQAFTDAVWHSWRRNASPAQLAAYDAKVAADKALHDAFVRERKAAFGARFD